MCTARRGHGLWHKTCWQSRMKHMLLTNPPDHQFDHSVAPAPAKTIVGAKIAAITPAAITLAGFLAFQMPQSLAATADNVPSIDNICLAEARRAEIQHGIPEGLMQSITRVESGRKTVTGEYMPWTWTLNDSGEGLFFDTRQAAFDYLQAAVDAGDHSVDVGCMQVNTKWHMDGFFELADMLDPVQNADYAASFLLDLFAAHQSWDGAVKHYHSSDPAKNVQYHARVLAELETFLASRDDSNTPEMTQVANADVMPAGDRRLPLSGETIQMAIEPEFGSAEFPPQQTVAASTLETSAANTDMPLNMAIPGMAIPALTASADDGIAPDQDKIVKERQPFIARNWDKVEQFRLMLSREAS